MKINLIGDIHGDFDWYLSQTESPYNEPSIQLGDYGLGFYYLDDQRAIEKSNDLHFNMQYFIRGNHDDLKVCKQCKNFLGDYGIIFDKILYLGGACSARFDRTYRQKHAPETWFRDEQIPLKTFKDEVIPFVEKHKDQIEIVVSHDCPNIVYNRYFEPEKGYKKDDQNRTPHHWDEVFGIVQPKRWFFGHHHLDLKLELFDCHFQCVNINQSIEIEL